MQYTQFTKGYHSKTEGDGIVKYASLVEHIECCGFISNDGRRIYGTAAVLAFNRAMRTRISDIDPKTIARGRKAIEMLFV